MTPLRELLYNASYHVEMYRNPSIDEFIESIDKVLYVMGFHIGHDKIETIDEYDGKVTIRTSYSVRGCLDFNEFEIPSYIIDSDNPVREAKIYATSNKLDDAKARLGEAERECKWWNEVVQDLEAELVIVKVLIGK